MKTLENLFLIRHVHSFEFAGDGFSIRVMREHEEGEMILVASYDGQPWKGAVTENLAAHYVPGVLVEREAGPAGLVWIPWRPFKASHEGFEIVHRPDREACLLALQIIEGGVETEDLRLDWAKWLLGRSWAMITLTDEAPHGQARHHLLPWGSLGTYCGRYEPGADRKTGDGVKALTATLSASPLLICEECEHGWAGVHGIRLEWARTETPA